MVLDYVFKHYLLRYLQVGTSMMVLYQLGGPRVIEGVTGSMMNRQHKILKSLVPF